MRCNVLYKKEQQIYRWLPDELRLAECWVPPAYFVDVYRATEMRNSLLDMEETYCCAVSYTAVAVLRICLP